MDILIKLRFFLFLCLALSFSSSALDASLMLPEPTGPFGVGKKTLHIHDTSRYENITISKYDKKTDSIIPYENITTHRTLKIFTWYPIDKRLIKTKRGAQQKMALDQEAPFIKKLLPPHYTLSKILLNSLLKKNILTNCVIDAPLSKFHQQYPLIVLSHSYWSHILLYTSYAEDLASHGFIVIGINHTKDCIITFDEDNNGIPIDESWNKQESLYGNDQFDYLSERVLTWKDDISFLIDSLSLSNENDIDNNLKQSIDLTKIGVVGHSTGGCACIYSAKDDKRIKAVCSLDGLVFKKDIKSIASNQPLMIINGGATLSWLNKSMSDKERSMLKINQACEMDIKKSYLINIPQLLKLSTGDTFYAVLKDAGHYSFCDISLLKDLLLADTPIIGPIAPYLSHLLFQEFNSAYNFQFGSINSQKGNLIVKNLLVDFFSKYLYNKSSQYLERSNNKPSKDISVLSWHKSEAHRCTP